MVGVDFFGFSGRIKLEALSFVLSEIFTMIENSVRKKLFKITGIDGEEIYNRRNCNYNCG